MYVVIREYRQDAWVSKLRRISDIDAQGTHRERNFDREIYSEPTVQNFESAFHFYLQDPENPPGTPVTFLEAQRMCCENIVKA